MELYVVLAITSNVLFTAIIAYCLSFAITKNSDDPETIYLRKVAKITRKVVIVGGCLFIAFIIYGLILSAAMTFSA